MPKQDIKIRRVKSSVFYNGGYEIVKPNLDLDFISAGEIVWENGARAVRSSEGLYVLQGDLALNGMWNQRGRKYQDIKSLSGVLKSNSYILVSDGRTVEDIERELDRQYVEKVQRAESFFFWDTLHLKGRFFKFPIFY